MNEMIKALLSNKNMHVGKIVDGETMTKNALQDAFLELAGGIIKKGGVLNGPYVLLCRQEMYLRLKLEWEDLGCVSLDGVRENAVPWFQTDASQQVICAVIGSVEFPAHYIVLTDWSQLRDFLLSGTDPNSGLLAIKGNSKNRPKPIVISTSWHVHEEDIVNAIENHEFIDGAHNPAQRIITHSQGALLRLAKDPTMKMGMFRGCIEMELKLDEYTKHDVDIVFLNGLAVSLIPARVDRSRRQDALTPEALISGKFGT